MNVWVWDSLHTCTSTCTRGGGLVVKTYKLYKIFKKKIYEQKGWGKGKSLGPLPPSGFFFCVFFLSLSTYVLLPPPPPQKKKQKGRKRRRKELFIFIQPNLSENSYIPRPSFVALGGGGFVWGVRFASIAK